VLEVAAPGKQKLPVVRPMAYRTQLICAGQVLDGTGFVRDRGKPAPTGRELGSRGGADRRGWTVKSEARRAAEKARLKKARTRRAY